MNFNINELKPGMQLKSKIVRADGTLILKEGTILTENIIERLRKLSNIRFVEDEIKETVNLDLKSSTEEAIKEFLKNPTDSNMNKIKQNTSELVKTIGDSSNYEYDLETYLSKTNDLSSHSVRVACFSILLAKIYNDSLRGTDKKALIDLNDIAVAAVLQDIGTMYEDEERFNKMNRIPNINVIEKYFPEIKNIPLDKYDERYAGIYSYCAVAGMDDISGESKLMLLLSREPETGDGVLKVPTEVSKKRSNFMYGAKIIKVCDMYDRSLEQAISNGKSLEEVVSELGQEAKSGIINEEIQGILINNVKLYPVKTRVMLSSGDPAVVEKSRVGQHDSYRPVVCTRPFPGTRIDLKETMDITIQSVVSKEKFEEIVRKQIEEAKNRVVQNNRRITQESR